MATVAGLEALRAELAQLVSSGATPGPEVAAAASILLAKWTTAGGPTADADPFVSIAKNVFGGRAPAPSPSAPAAASEYQRIPFDFLESFMRDVLVEAGVPPDEADVSADVLITADKRGVDSHGIGRLKPIYIDRIQAGILKPTAPFTIVKETDTTALIDGGGGLGLFVGPKAMQICLDKAKKCGIAAVAVRNSTHYGAACYYPMMADKVGCIAVTGTNARPSIAPTFGVEPMLGTNPMTWGTPSSDPFPFIIDCATSVNQRGKIEKYAREGLPTPVGQVIDRSGAIRTDTDGILRDLVTGQCSLAPLGGTPEGGNYKGYGYATIVEILSSALCGGLTSPDLSGVDKETGKKIPMPLGHWFIAIDVERFVPLTEFKQRTGEFLGRMRKSEPDPTGPGRIYTAGELEYDASVERAANGGTPVPPALQKDMVQLRELYPALAEKYPKFPFE